MRAWESWWLHAGEYVHERRIFHADVAQINAELYGRYEHLYELRDAYTAAVLAAGDDPRPDPQVQATGLLLARAQRSATTYLQQRRRRAAMSGVDYDGRRTVPSTVEDFMALQLQEQARAAEAAESLAYHTSRVGVASSCHPLVAANAHVARRRRAGR
jgi:hypothetical protein